MRAGKLRHRIEIQTVTTAQSTSGEETRTWPTAETDDDLTVVWADVQDLAGRELLLAQQASSEATVRVRLRHLDGITSADCRIVHGDRTLEIVAVIPDGRGRELELLCKELT